MQKGITTYPDINEFLQELQDELQKVFGEKLVGVYLYGSLVWGDFDYDSSDIDVLVVSSSEIDQKTFDQLNLMQENLAKKYKHAREGMIEIVYASVHTLQTFKSEQNQVAVMSPGEPFHFKDAGIDWLMNWYAVREQSITLYGSAPKTIIPPVIKDEFIQAVQKHAMHYREWINDMHKRPSQAYAILTLCRAFYTTKYGEQVSKKKAAEWAEKQLPEWAGLIRNALQWREDWRNKEVDNGATFTETKRFVNFMIDTITNI